MTVAEWLKMARADAERRGGPELIAALDGLAKATATLRAADWNDDTKWRSAGIAASKVPGPAGESKEDLPRR